MEVSSPKTKKKLEGTFQAQNIKNLLLNNFLYFRKWHFLAPSLKHSQFFSKKNFFISQQGNF